jgi:hypothetical protein
VAIESKVSGLGKIAVANLPWRRAHVGSFELGQHGRKSSA